MIAAQRGDLLIEILEGVEGPVHGREPQVSDLVQFAQRPQNRAPDVIGADFGPTGGPDVLFDPLREQRECVFIDRTTLASLAYPGDNLLATEGLGGAAALDHKESGRLQGGEAAATRTARAAAADCGAPVSFPAVNNAAVRGLTEGTAHEPGPPFPFIRPAPSAVLPIAFRRRLTSRAVDTLVGNRPKSVGNLLNNLWTTYMGVTTRCCVPDSRARLRGEQVC